MDNLIRAGPPQMAPIHICHPVQVTPYQLTIPFNKVPWAVEFEFPVVDVASMID